MPEHRLQNLETMVRALRNEVRELRDEVVRLREENSLRESGEVGASASGPTAVNHAVPGARAPSPDESDHVRDRRISSAPVSLADRRNPSVAPRLTPPSARIDGIGLEAVVGRYGTLAVAAVLVLMGVGAFVTWAASRIVIGPTMRVALGAFAALALAVAGRRIAERGSVAFGSTILALALAVAHVDAWAAGPVLHVVPNIVALGAAALASVALAALALRERNETLFAVGVGGALLAPFVTGDRESSVLLLLIYGWVVVATALAAARPGEWAVTTRLVALGAMGYAAVAVGGTTDGLPDALAAGAFPLACAWAAYLWGGRRHRAAMSLGFVALGAGALLILSLREPAPAFLALAVIGTTSAYIMLESRASSRPQIAAGALVLPLAFLLCALAAVGFAQQRGALIASGWVIAAAVLARVSHGRRDMHLAAASSAGLIAIAYALHDRPVECVMVLGGAAVVIAYIARRADARPVLLPLGIAILAAATWSHVLLSGRSAFAYVPFLTRESLAALVVVTAALAAWRLTRHLSDHVRLAGALAFGAALFLWGRAELGRAIRPEVATFSLMLYYAAFGMIAIAVGRRRGTGQLRIAGITLALYAAAKAVVQASGLTTIGLRVGSYLLVGGFLLAVAYWYRAASTRPADQPAAGG